MSVGIGFIVFMLVSNFVEKITLFLILLITIICGFIILFFYFFKLSSIKIKKLERLINKEIIFAGRFLMVELESGVPLYSTLKNMGNSYKAVGAYFREIVEKVNVGTALEDAINESLETVPSESLRKILWQISNSLSTGSDMAKPLQNVIETLIKEQQIEVGEYGRKLNPLAMFYMLMAIIVPSLGVTLLTIISIFIGIKLSLIHLLVLAGLIGFMQMMFIALVNSSRPSVEF